MSEPRPGPDPEVVLSQALRVMAGGPKAAPPAGGSTADLTPLPRRRMSDRRWLVLVGIFSLLAGVVAGVGSWWLW